MPKNVGEVRNLEFFLTENLILNTFYLRTFFGGWAEGGEKLRRYMEKLISEALTFAPFSGHRLGGGF